MVGMLVCDQNSLTVAHRKIHFLQCVQGDAAAFAHIDEQIALLESRGMKIDDKEKAKENLLDIGYYRLGFYWFPFEKTYPRKSNRNHEFNDGIDLDYAIKLYYFDFLR